MAGSQKQGRIRSGQRKHKATLQQGVETTDAMGGRSQSWETYDTDWAMVTPMPFVVSETQASVLFTVGLRYRTDLVEKYHAGTQQRLLVSGHQLKVLAVVNPDEKNRDLILHCAPDPF